MFGRCTYMTKGAVKIHMHSRPWSKKYSIMVEDGERGFVVSAKVLRGFSLDDMTSIFAQSSFNDIVSAFRAAGHSPEIEWVEQ